MTWGAPKTLLALYSLEDDGLHLRHRQRFESAAWSSLEPMLATFLQQRPRTIAPPAMAAWPSRVQCANAQLSRITNLPWQLQEDALAQAAEVEQLGAGE